jgi:hypothetical protein
MFKEDTTGEIISGKYIELKVPIKVWLNNEIDF